MHNFREYRIFLFILCVCLWACSAEVEVKKETSKQTDKPASSPLKKIPVLNMGSFHFGMTTDENKTEFDEHDLENQKAAHAIAAKLAAFKPSVIVVEVPPKYDKDLQEYYDEYKADPDMPMKNPTETELIAFELGRLANTQRIHGIDHKMNYNYRIARDIENNTIDSSMVTAFYKYREELFDDVPKNQDSLSLLEKMKIRNTDSYLDYMFMVNADILTHAGSENNFEGADQATLFYQRNLRMFSNLNRLKLTEDDRVFILMGAAHTAFFRDFLSRNPKYKLVSALDYL